MLKIMITTESIEWLCNELGCEANEAEEFAQMFIGVLQASGGTSTAAPDAAEQQDLGKYLEADVRHGCATVVNPPRR